MLSDTSAVPKDYSSMELLDQGLVDSNEKVNPSCRRPTLAFLAAFTALCGAAAFATGYMLENHQGVQSDGLVQSMVAVEVKIPSRSQMAEIDALAWQWFNCEVIGEEGEPCVDATEKAIHLSRWAFHDAATHSKTGRNGGAHGCQLVEGSLQRNCPSNHGLQIETRSAVLVWEKYLCVDGNCVCSKVDWVHYLAAVGIKFNSAKAEVAGTGYTIDMTPADKFVWGRTDCYDQGALTDATCGYASRLPPSKLNWDEMVASMGDNGFTEAEIVVINAGGHGHGGLGAHSMHLPGSWTADDGKLDTLYCKAIQTPNWMNQKTDKSLGKTSFKEFPQWGGCFETVELAPGSVIPKGAECPPFSPLGPDGLPLGPGHEPGCFMQADGTEICNPYDHLKALSTDLNAYWDMDGTCGLMLGGTKPLCNKKPLGSQLIDQYADDWAFFVTSYESAHIKMSKFGNENTVRFAGAEPVNFWTEVVYVPGTVASNPVG